MSSTYERNRMVTHLKIIEAGIVPVDRDTIGAEGRASIMKIVRESLSSLSPEDRRKSTRKFRKLQRKVSKELLKHSKSN